MILGTPRDLRNRIVPVLTENNGQERERERENYARYDYAMRARVAIFPRRCTRR